MVKRNKQSDIEKDEILLFHVRNENNRFIIESPLPSKLSNDNYDVLNNKIFIYLSPKDTDKKIYSSYYLLDNDIIKLGNIKYLVKIYIKNNYTNITTNTTDNSLNYDISSLNKDSKLIIEQYQEIKSYYESLTFQDKIICKICKAYEKCNSDNPMIKVCKCNIYYHFSCLKNMIQYYRTFEKENEDKTVKNYYYKGVNCKVCKISYPLVFLIKKKIYKLIDITEPNSDYLVLESIEKTMFYGHYKLIHVIQLRDKEIKIGRNSKKNDVIICDPSVSREHGALIWNEKEKKIFLINLSQKFGTYVLLKKPLTINKNIIQIGIGKIFVEAHIENKNEDNKEEGDNEHNLTGTF